MPLKRLPAGFAAVSRHNQRWATETERLQSQEAALQTS